MNYSARLKQLEKAAAPQANLTVEIVEEGNEILVIKNGTVTHRTAIEEDGETQDEYK